MRFGFIPRSMGWAATSALALAACMVAPETAPLQDEPADPGAAAAPSAPAASPAPTAKPSQAAPPEHAPSPAPQASPSRKPGEVLGNVTTLDGKYESPYALALDADDTLYVLEGASKAKLYKLAADGKATSVSLAEPLEAPRGLVIAGDGTMYIADTGNRRVLKRAPKGELTVLADTTTEGLTTPAGAVALFEPWGLALDKEGALFVADAGNHTILRLVEGEPVQIVAGTGTKGSENGPGAEAQFDRPRALAFNSKGELFVGDFGNTLIRKFKDGEVSTYEFSAGTVEGPGGMAFDKTNTLYVTGSIGQLIYSIDNRGQTKVLAGRMIGIGNHADGQGNQARFSEPEGLVLTKDSTLYVADRSNGRIRKIQ